MLRVSLALVALFCGVARGQAPAYSSAGIVNAANFAPGPFAPNSIVTLFGTNLSRSPESFAPPQTAGGDLPTQLGFVSVYVDNRLAPLIYVSDTQINFLIPSDEIPGPVPVRVVRQSWSGPEVSIDLVGTAPCLFPQSEGFALAENWNAGYAVVTPAEPAHPGDTIIIYATGMGRTQPAFPVMTIPALAAQIQALADLKVTIGGVALDTTLVKYAGQTPGFAGLYQINLVLPANTPNDPELRVFIGDRSTPPGIKLAVR